MLGAYPALTRWANLCRASGAGLAGEEILFRLGFFAENPCASNGAPGEFDSRKDGESGHYDE